MTRNEAVRFLEAHPPEEWKRSQELMIEFSNILDVLIRDPDERCIRHLVFSLGVGAEDFFKEKIGKVLNKFSDQQLIPIIREAIHSTNTDIKNQALELSWSFTDSTFRPYYLSGIKDSSTGVRSTSAIGLWSLGRKEDIPAIKAALEKEKDEEVKRCLRLATKKILGRRL